MYRDKTTSDKSYVTKNVYGTKGLLGKKVYGTKRSTGTKRLLYGTPNYHFTYATN